MSARWIAASVFVAFAGTAFGQSEAVLGRADAAFAQSLLKAGYPDLASQLCELLQRKGNLEPEEAVGVRALYLDLRLDLALKESDLLKRKDLLTTILQEKEDLIRQYAGRKVAQDATASLPEIYQKLGETISVAIQKEKDPAVIAQLQKDGADTFKAAEQKLEARIEDLKQALSESTSANPALEDQLVAARYNLPRTYYFHALLFGKSDTLSRDTLLDQAITLFQEFGLDYSDRLFYFEGLVYEGLCSKEKGAVEDALLAFDDAIRLRELYGERDGRGLWPMEPVAADLVSWAILQKMEFLNELGRTQEAIDTAKDFWNTTHSPQETRYGLAVLAARAEAHLKLGDTKSAGEMAEKLVEYDPRGPWGGTGREIQGRLLASGGTMEPDKMLRIAQTLLDRGDPDQALRVARQAADAVGRDPALASVGVNAWLMIGTIYLRRDPAWDHEAALAFDIAAERFGGDEQAAEAVYQSMQAYSRLARAERKTIYKDRAAERQRTLASRYTNSPRAAWAQLQEAEDLVGEGKYVEAAELYGRVQPSSSVYLEAQFRAGDCYFLQAYELLKKDATKAEGKTFAQQAERLMRKAMADADKEWADTLDFQKKATLDGLGLRARNRLAQLYLLPDLGKAAEVLTLLEGTDERFASNEEVISTFWRYRIDALRQLGKLDEAVTMLDALMRRTPDSKAIGPAAGNLARALDERYFELRDKEKKPKEAAEMLRKAAGYYAIEGRALLQSDNPNVRKIETTAMRLFTIGLIANEVPDDQQTFVGWDPKNTKEESHWKLSAELLAAALRILPGYAMQITEARSLGYLGQYDRAASILGTLFDREPLYDADKKVLNRQLLRSKPDLLGAYIEWGVAEHLVAVKDSDTDRYRRAQVILGVMVRNLDANTRSWWWAKYYEIRNALYAGLYNDARFLFNDLERTTSGMGKDFGLEPLFRKLKDELK